MPHPYSLMIHGGAGALEDMKFEASPDEFQASLNEILEQGRTDLEQGKSALDVVEHCVILLENNPLFNAGRGSVLNANGQVEMDAALMEGQTLRAGGVTCVPSIKNPIALARRVMDQGDHVLLAGQGALDFAKAEGIDLCPNDYFVTETRLQQLKAARAAGKMTLDHERIHPQKLGTVGAVARDRAGHLAAATSTGGLVNKRWGRVGDTPIVGAGVFADDATCAVSATGYGEQFLRTVFAKTVSTFIEFQHLDADGAAKAGIEYLVRKVKGDGGVIVIDTQGRCGAAQSTSGLIHGWIEHEGPNTCKLG